MGLGTLFVVLVSTACCTSLIAVGCLNRVVTTSVKDLTADEEEQKNCCFCCKRKLSAADVEKETVAKFEARAKYKKELERKYGIIDENEARRRKEQKVVEKEYEASRRSLHVEIIRAEQLQDVDTGDPVVVECF